MKRRHHSLVKHVKVDSSPITPKDQVDPPVTAVKTFLRNTPNNLSLVRLAAIPAFIISFFSHSKLLATSIFVMASLTDFLDGYIARKFHLTSEFGAFIDPVADKVVTFNIILWFNTFSIICR